MSSLHYHYTVIEVHNDNESIMKHINRIQQSLQAKQLQINYCNICQLFTTSGIEKSKLYQRNNVHNCHSLIWKSLTRQNEMKNKSRCFIMITPCCHANGLTNYIITSFFNSQTSLQLQKYSVHSIPTYYYTKF